MHAICVCTLYILVQCEWFLINWYIEGKLMSHNEDIEYTENLSVHRNQPHHENQEHYDDSDTTHVPFIADDRLQRSVQKEDVTDKGYAWFILISMS